MEIIIDIEDTKIFTYLAFLFDRDSVIEKIFEIRRCWNLEAKLINYDEFDDWNKELHYDFSLTPEVYNFLEKAAEEVNLGNPYITSLIDLKKTNEIANLSPMDLELEYLMRKNGINPRFKQLILRGIVCGKITISDWNEATNNKSEFVHGAWIFDITPFEVEYVGTSKDEIKRDRTWYFERKVKKVSEIAQSTSYRPEHIHPKDYEENVLKPALRRYRKFLKIKGLA